MLKTCKALKFEEEPNYVFFKEQLKAMFVANKFEYDLTFDWTVHAMALERKSTFQHLADRQNQFAKRQQSAKRGGLDVNGREEK